MDLRPFKCRTYKGGEINCLISIKLDGVMLIIKDGKTVSRTNKQLYNCPILEDGVYEVFNGNFKDTVSKIKTHESIPFAEVELFKLYPKLDERLIIRPKGIYKEDYIRKLADLYIDAGHEGLMLHTDKYIYKVKKHDSTEIKITGIEEGTGKYVGMLGAFLTDKGKVGTGFTDEERKELFTTPIGTLIEVNYMEMTKDKKFRHPVFKCIRTIDK